MTGDDGRRGSVRQSSNGTWYFVVDTTPPGTAERRQTRRRGFPTRRAAQAALTKTLRDLADHSYVPPARQNFRDYLTETWLPAIRSSVRSSTFDSYARNVRVHVAPKAIGGVPLQRVDAAMLNVLYADLLTGLDRAALSQRSVAYVHVILHRAFRDGVRWNLLSRNPADAADPPRARPADRVRARVWSAEELTRFLELTADSRYAMLWRLVATTGVRRGEALALRWSDVDLRTARASISRSLVEVGDYARGGGGNLEFSPPKTNRGRRSIALDGDSVVALRTHRVRQNEERLRIGEDYQDQGLIFSLPDGRPVHPKVASNLFRKAVTRHEMTPLSLHGLRHTWATLALQAGVHPKVVQERLGHATISITLDIYSHVNPGLDAEAADTVAALLRPRADQDPRFSVTNPVTSGPF